jgi:hypothetical protein
MKPTFTLLLASFIIFLNSFAQMNTTLTEINISENSPHIKTSIIGESSNGIVAYQINNEENSISIGTINSNNNFQPIKKEILKDYSVENVFLRGSKALVFTSNLNNLNGKEFKKNEVAPKVIISLLEVDLNTKMSNTTKNVVQFEYINNATFYEGNLKIAESENQKFTGVCYGFTRGYSKPKKFTSYMVLFDNNIQEVNKVTWKSDRALAEVKRYEEMLVSNSGIISILTLSNYSQKMKSIIPMPQEIIMKSREYEDQLPGLTYSDFTRQYHSTNQVSVIFLAPDLKTPIVKYIDFEDKLQYVSYNGCKMVFDKEENILLAGLFSDAFNNFYSKGIFISKINSSSDQMEILYQEYFSEEFVREILPNEKLKASATTKFQKGKNPHINNVAITNITKLEDGEFTLLLEFEDYDIGNTKFGDFDKKNESFTGNMQLLKFTEGGSKLDWSLSFSKKNYLYMPKPVIGSNKSYIHYFPGSNSLILMFNEQNTNQTPKPSSVLGTEIDFPKLVMYDISISGELGEKQEILNNTEAIICPEKNIKIGDRLILQGTHKDVQELFEL